jgi:hypothetical protein
MRVNRVSFNVLAMLGWAALAVASAAQAQEPITTNDGLALRLSPDGKVSRVTVDGKRLPVGKAPGIYLK